MNRQTTLANASTINPQWLIVDAAGQTLGRLSTKLAVILQGKHKPEYTPHVDTGDFIIVINVEKIRLTGKKADQKFFQRYSGFPSGLNQRSYRWMIENQPELLLERSVRRMLPKNKLASHMLKKMKTYRGSEHPHSAQQPMPLSA